MMAAAAPQQEQKQVQKQVSLFDDMGPAKDKDEVKDQQDLSQVLKDDSKMSGWDFPQSNNAGAAAQKQ